jgi:hypothetical protein
MVRLLVWAGANVNACRTTGNIYPALAQALAASKQEEDDAQILDLLLGKDGLCSMLNLKPHATRGGVCFGAICRCLRLGHAVGSMG